MLEKLERTASDEREQRLQRALELGEETKHKVVRHAVSPAAI